MQQQQKARLEGDKTIPMISSFLNLCRVCPVPADDKVNSEYKRNFTWHDGYQAAKVDVIKNAPSLPHSTVEPPLPRKKKHPELAYRTRELLFDYEEGESSDSQEIVTGSHAEHDARARPEEKTAGKNKASPRSRSADSSINRKMRTTSVPDEDNKPSGKDETNEKEPLMTQTCADSKGESVPKTTEYRSQFVAWRRLQEETGISSTARKSASMGLIASKKDTTDGEVVVNAESNCGKAEDEPDEDAALDAVKKGKIKKTEYKAKFRPFSAYTYVDGNWKKSTRLIKESEVPPDMDSNTWYSEVVERLKKADQYRVRSHGGLPFHGQSDQHLPPEALAHVRDRSVLSPISIGSGSRTWKDDRPVKERARPAPASVHHSRKDKKETDSIEQPKMSPKKKSIDKATARPKSAEPVIPAGKGENKSPKRTRPRAPRDLPVHGHGDLSGRKKSSKQGITSPHSKGSPMDSKARPLAKTQAGIVNGDDGKVWLKPASKISERKKSDDETVVNGYPEEDGKLVNGEPELDSIQYEREPKINGHEELFIPPAVTKPPMRVPLTTVKSPEEVTGVRSPDPESWTVPLDIGKGLQWMDGKTPDGGQTKTTPIILSKRLRESSLAATGQKEYFVCDPASGVSSGESVDL